jgi:RNA polymerase sigma-70 factor (ECF subfamily)
VLSLLESLGPRVSAIFRSHRIDGMAQKQIAAAFGISVSTVESDLRIAYRALAQWKERSDGA